MKTNIIIQGDCIEELKKLPENSVDAIITDPPYGLEFMGKEWDKFEPNRLTQRWAGTERKLIGDGSGKGSKDFGERFNEMPKYIPKKNKKCKKCGHYFYSGTPCKCEIPEWEIDNKYENHLQTFCQSWATECLRVLKPGGFLLSFGGTRTYHRLVCGIEDAGFEIRDTIMWLYGSGFPKSLNIGKQIDKMRGNERKVVGIDIQGKKSEGVMAGHHGWAEGEVKITKGNSEWEGWGTALKPACEPIVVARKPLSEKNVALNVLKWGTGGINIDECRISLEGEKQPIGSAKRVFKSNQYTDEKIYGDNKKTPEQGRFPANILLSCFCDKTEQGKEKISGGFGAMEIGMSDTGKGKTQKYDNTKSKSKENKFLIHTNPNCPCYMLDEQSGIEKGNGKKYSNYDNKFDNAMFNAGEEAKERIRVIRDKGGASRFFYCAKSSKAERNNFGEVLFELKKDTPKEIKIEIEKHINTD